MAFLRRSTGIPLWLMLLAFVVVMVPLLVVGFRAQAGRGAAVSAAYACPARRTWTISDVIEASPKAAYGRIIWHDGGGRSFQHDFPTEKGIGDEVLLEMVFDCRADDGNSEIVPGCICKRISTVDLMGMSH